MGYCKECGVELPGQRRICNDCRNRKRVKWRKNRELYEPDYLENRRAQQREYYRKTHPTSKRFYEKYGLEAKKRFEDAEGLCEKKGCSDQATRLHHVNGNHEDNRYENFRVLCLKHHRAIHRFIRKELVSRFPQLVNDLSMEYLK